jgi:membrane-bound serine protease (ClpP class)
MSVLLAQTAQTATATADTNWLAIGLGLAVLALVFFALELFIPTGGVLATLCGTSVFGSIASLFIYDTNAGGFALVAYLIAAPFAVVYGIKLWARTPIGRTLILGSTESALTDGMDEETAAHETAKARRDQAEALRAMIGKHGTVQTTLRPVGVVVIDGNRLDALAEDGVIDEGAAIEVVDAYDNQLKVRAAV